MKMIQIHPGDNVAVALSPIEQGEMLEISGFSYPAAQDIPQGHKMALQPIKKGEPVMKYGFPIGYASCDIEKGQWVHTHNVKTGLSGELEYTYQPTEIPALSAEPVTFQGFLREDGRAAVRNEIWILPTVGCVNSIAEQMVKGNQDLVTGSVEGIYTFPHPDRKSVV